MRLAHTGGLHVRHPTAELVAMAEDSKKRKLLFWSGETQKDMGPIKLADWVRPLWTSARDGDWAKVLEIVPIYENSVTERCWPVVNACCPFHGSQYSLLHFAAHLGAPKEIVSRLLEMGAWRSLQNARGERPVDLARKHNHGHLSSILEPEYKRYVPLGILLRMQERFHEALRRWDNLHRMFDKYRFRLPQLEPMLEVEPVEFRFAVETWVGGFNYELVEDGLDPRLICFGASRVSGGTVGKIEVTPAGVKSLPWR